MEFILAFIITINFFLIIGTVGGIECGNISMSTGFWICIGLAALTYVLFTLMEFVRISKNNSKKPLDKSKKMCYNRHSKCFTAKIK